MFSSPTKQPNPWLSTDKGQETTDVMKTQLPLPSRVKSTVKYQSNQSPSISIQNHCRDVQQHDITALEEKKMNKYIWFVPIFFLTGL